MPPAIDEAPMQRHQAGSHHRARVT
jgi:hypothetical protein